ncbi:MAG: hypothetical protein ACFB0C_23560 [Leptolyngbyaceae cyanobacterium]
MQRLGGTLLFFGIGSFILNRLGMEFILLMWIDAWGPGIAVLIRVVLIVLGITLIALGNKRG